MLIKSSAEGSRQLFRQRQDGNLNVFFAAPVVAPKPSIFPVGLIEGLFVFSRSNEKARRRFEGKRVINGIRSTEFNLLPLKYHEAYRIYKQMKANHWEPDVIDMTKDCAQWNTGVLSAKERWIIEMGVGYFSSAEGIVGDSVLHVIEDNLTAAELKHASLRHIAEES